MITETITFHFDDEEQQKRFHAVLEQKPKVVSFHQEQIIEGLRYPAGRYQIARLGPIDETEDIAF